MRSREAGGSGCRSCAREGREVPVLALLLLFGCDVFGPATVRLDFAVGDLDVVEFRPSATHVMWWHEVEECAGLTRDIDEIRFYRVLAPLTPSKQQFPCFSEGRLCTGVYDGDIYVATGMVTSERTMKHEMLHAIRRGGDHDAVLFLRCT